MGSEMCIRDRNYLEGYERYAFEELDYNETSALPVTLDAHNQMMWGLKAKAEEAPSVFEATILLRDACAYTYFWETGQRGADCCALKMSDFMYEDIESTSACWNDIVTRQLDLGKLVVVESSGEQRHGGRATP